MPSNWKPSGCTIGTLYMEEREALLRYARSLTREQARAEDLVQDAFARAMSHLDTLESLTRGQRRAWLYRSIKNRFVDQVRRRKRWKPIQMGLEREAMLSCDPVVAEVRFWELLDSVPPNHREILNDRFVLGLNSTEIGARRGIPPATARSRLRLAVGWIRKNRAHLLRED